MRRWYVVTTYSGYENSVKQDLERRIQSMNMQDKIYQVLVPEEAIHQDLLQGQTMCIPS